MMFTKICSIIEICLTIVVTDKSSKFYFGENKKVIGKFKDETAGNPIKDFTGH